MTARTPQPADSCSPWPSAGIIEVPSRKPPQTVLLQFRHPKRAPIKGAAVDGKPWNDFDPGKEIVRLPNARGLVRVETLY